MNETQIFAKAIQQDSLEQREQLVEQLCQGNPELKSRVDELLAAHDNPQSFFERPIAQVHNSNPAEQPTLDVPPKDGSAEIGARIGPYKLLQQIGEGGMGIVFMAEQTEPVKRRVALKIIKPGMDSRQVVARFEAERQALAMMDHPNIAKVLDAGTTDRGQPYFVMELVNGSPITEYCDEEKMAPVQRLKLFVSVCRAVQHAHQKGIIHRDLKPNNILVAEYDGLPVPKVIDFGVAKATGSQLTDKTLFTEFGQVIGTLEYMSPEQARRNQLDVDTRSDIYSLGIVLYALLTGETPFGRERFRKAAWDEMLKIIREEEPQRPSIKIGSSQSLDQVASQRGVEPNRLSSLVRGDLDWIVMKTLEKDRNRRYASASELADDVTRHLSEQPVVARPPSTLDRVTKFARRNRIALFTSAAVVLVSAVAAFWTYSSAVHQANQVAERTNRLRQATNDASISLVKAQASRIGNQDSWEAAGIHCQRIEDLLAQGPVEDRSKNRAHDLLKEFGEKLDERDLAAQIEEVVIQGATKSDLASWQAMESEMRAFFRNHGFDLDKEEPSVIGEKIRDHPHSERWADLLELWIGTRGQMAAIGGPKLNAAIMQPWAEAIYVADDDPIRTGIRKFYYTPNRNRATLDELVKDVDLESLSPRTLAWLGHGYCAVKAFEQGDHVFEIALHQYPNDLMLNHDYGYALFHQARWHEAARIFHRCLAIRNDVSGIWINLAETLDELDELKAAEKARARAAELENRNP